MASNDGKGIIPGFDNVSQYVSNLFRSVVATSKTTNSLPTAGNDYDFYASFSAFQEAMSLEGDRLLELMTNIMKHQGAHNCRLGRQQTANDLEEKTDAVIDANDLILERVNNLLDEASGKKKSDAALVIASLKEGPRVPSGSKVASWNREAAGVRENRKSERLNDVRLLAAKNVQRPQLSFKDSIDNSPLPFVSKLRDKPHSKTPFYGFQSSDMDGDELIHPYQTEIRSLTYPVHQLEPHPEPIPFPESVESTPFAFVDSVAALVSLREALEKVDSFAVDLEAHSFRSFQGLTCLMQISTAHQDYIVDVLVPEVRQELQTLNMVFADPAIVKIFHGADWDIKWLQRDFGIYVVNMFDTYQASKLLNIPRHSLAYLLSQYCGVETNKKYQLADWRIRPLPEELLNYARTDTRFLGYIAAKMKNELLENGNAENNLLLATLNHSAQVCLQLYTKTIFDPLGYKGILRNHKKNFNSQQLAALESLYSWRDSVARREDESVGFVLPNHMMLSISEVLPREPNGVIACCNPLPPLVQQQLNEIHRLILDAKDVALVKTGTPNTPTTPVQKLYALNPKYNSEKLLHCPIDSSHGIEDDDVSMQTDEVDPPGSAAIDADVGLLEKAQPILALGCADRQSINPHAGAAAKASAIHDSILSPFFMFLPVNPKLVRPSAPKWRIRMLKKSSKLIDIQKASKTEPVRKRNRAEEEEEKAKKAKTEKLEKKKLIPLSDLKEMEEELEKKNGKAQKKKKKGMKKGEEIDVAEINRAKAKIFRESKNEKQVLGKSKDQEVLVDADHEDAQETKLSGEQSKKKKKITPFDYSKSDVKVFSKGVDKKKAKASQINPNVQMNKKKKGVKKTGVKQHYGGKDSFTTAMFGNCKKGGNSRK